MGIIVYCAQVGILRYILDSMRGARHPQAQQDANGVNVNAGQGGENVVAQPENVPQIGNIPHATTGGMCTDFQIFFMSLFMSLIPSWTPIGMNAPIIPIEGPAHADDLGDFPAADVAGPAGGARGADGARIVGVGAAE